MKCVRVDRCWALSRSGYGNAKWHRLPAGDVALHSALGLRDEPRPAQAAAAIAEAWRPWRSYAVIRAWSAGPRASAKLVDSLLKT